MTTLEFSRLSTPCFYRQAGVMCVNGSLFDAKGITDVSPHDNRDTNLTGPLLAFEKEQVRHEAVAIEGMPVMCPACEGKGRILTPEGREMLVFLQTFMRPSICEMIEEILEMKL